MDTTENNEFDDELKSMEELMREDKITLNEETLQAPLQNLSLKTPTLVEAGTIIKECVRILLQNKTGYVLVMDKDKLRGIFTERDILAKIVGIHKDLTSVNVEEFMTMSPKTLHVEDSMAQALRLMNQGGYRHVPLVDHKNQPVAVVSVKEIVSYIVEFFPQDVLNLPPHPIRRGTKDREGG